MRVLWHSVAPWASSGYGNQTETFTPRIRDLGHDVAISAYWGLEGDILHWNGMPVYPADGEWGSRLLPTYVGMHQADLTITLMDVWPLVAKNLSGISNLASWLPVDHDPIPGKTVEFFEASGSRPIAMSRFGERLLQDLNMDPLYVPHGVDTVALSPQRDHRNETREKFMIPRDAFVIGMVAANKGRTPCRKAFPEVMQAFAEFKKECPKAHLHLHSDPTTSGQGVPMKRLMERCGVPEGSVTFAHPIRVELGMPTVEMARMYSAFDVLANPSYGEGFGIPIVEAQSCGVPVIITDFSAMPELCGAGWLVETDQWYDAQHGAFFGRPRPESIVEAFRKAYKARHDKDLRARARDFALGYDADLVTETYWKPALEALDVSTMPTAVLNRTEPVALAGAQ
jgi:glycosyltransferase involved in cell wall biosynthesis